MPSIQRCISINLVTDIPLENILSTVYSDIRKYKHRHMKRTITMNRNFAEMKLPTSNGWWDKTLLINWLPKDVSSS